MASSPNPSNHQLRFLIVGGVAAGASAAARARRLDEQAHITILERGPDVSFANCGLPYYIGGEIGQREALAVQTPQSLHALLNLDVRTHTEAVAIERANRRVQVRHTETGETGSIEYDKLLLAPGASPIRPPLQGIESSRILTLRNLQDMDRITERLKNSTRVTVIGAGFIGLEMAEQLVRLGKTTTLVELQDQVLPQMDEVMTKLVSDEIRKHGVDLILGDGIAQFSDNGSTITSMLNSGRAIEADLVILSIGVRPENDLARQCGLDLGTRGHIRVNPFQQTSDPDIYAAGDAVETVDPVTGHAAAIPLGGPANRQGRVAADHIFLGDKARPYPGSLGTAIVRVFEVTAGLTGWTEKRARQVGLPFKSVMVNATHHASYYPGALPMAIKLLWNPDNGRVLGGQVTGFEGVDKRIDVLATAIAGGLTIDDLCHLELSYAPPFGAAKDIVNFAGFAALNTTDGLFSTVDALPSSAEAQILDVRPADVAAAFPLDHAVNIPFPMLRSRLHELDPQRPVVTVCTFGKMSYFAARVLMQHGFHQVSSFTGGIRANIDPRSPAKLPSA